MKKSDYALVLITIVIGILPGYYLHQYLAGHPSAMAKLSGVNAAEENLTSIATGTVQGTDSTITAVYQSRPEKETDGICVNSYYMSFTLTFESGGKFSLTKSCESIRDPSLTWYGTVSATSTQSDVTATSTATTSDALDLSIDGDEHGTLITPQHIVLVRQGGTASVTQTDLNEISTSTIFVQVPKAK